MEYFFRSVNNSSQENLSFWVSMWYAARANHHDRDGRFLRRLMSLVLYQGRSSEGQISKDEALHFLNEQFEASDSMEPVLVSI